MPWIRPTLIDIDGEMVPRLVRDQRDRRPIPAEGRRYPEDLPVFLRRALRAGDVEIVPEPPSGTEGGADGASETPEPVPEPGGVPDTRESPAA